MRKFAEADRQETLFSAMNACHDFNESPEDLGEQWAGAWPFQPGSAELQADGHGLCLSWIPPLTYDIPACGDYDNSGLAQ